MRKVGLLLLLALVTACSAPEPESKAKEEGRKDAQTTAAATTSKPESGRTAVGRVGGRTFYEEDIDAEFASMPQRFQAMKDNPAMRANVLNNLMTRYALEQKAKAMGYDEKPEVKARLERMRQTVLIQAMNNDMREKQKPTDEEIASYYEANKQRFFQPEQVQVRHILVKTENQAKALLARLRKGEDFATLAKQYSEDKGTKNNGGLLPPFPRGRMVPPFEQAAFSLKEPGALAGPVKTRFGFHIIRFEKRLPARQKTLAEVKTQISNLLQQQRFRDWVEKVKEEQGLEILAPRYQRGRPGAAKG